MSRHEHRAKPEPSLILHPSDAFQKREKASEDYAIRAREKEKLLELKKKLEEQKEHLNKLSAHMYATIILHIIFLSTTQTPATSYP